MKGYIYKIYDNTNGNVYYGSTIETLSKRIAKHRYDHKKWINNEVNKKCSSSIILINNDYSYYIVEEVEYENKWELRCRERYYIENNICVNKQIPNRNKQEYNQDNKDKINLLMKNWKEDNKEYLKSYMKDYDNKRNSTEERKLQLKENAKNNYIKNKEFIKCECGYDILKQSLLRHKKTKKHITYINNLTQ